MAELIVLTGTASSGSIGGARLAADGGGDGLSYNQEAISHGHHTQ